MTQRKKMKKMNDILLRQKMIEKNISQKDIINELGISKSSTHRKIHGLNEFTRSEIKQLISLLDLSAEEVMNIFFDSDVS